MIVSDSSPIIYYSRVGRLFILKELYETIYLPRGVIRETVEEAVGKPGVSQIRQGIDQGWLKAEDSPTHINHKAEGIESVDAEVISLAKSKGLHLLTNDKALARAAKAHGVKPIWLSTTPVECVRRRLLTRDEGQRLLIELVKAGLRIRSEVLARIIEMLFEAEK